MNLDDIFQDTFLNGYNERSKKKQTISQEESLIAESKKRQLATIITFLDKFVGMDVYVNHYDIYSLNTLSRQDLKPQKFTYQLDDSSKRWAPGISIVIQHPGNIEIAIPNKPSEEGAVVVHLSTPHPQAHLLQGNFSNQLQVCEAMARFLSFSTTSIGKNSVNSGSKTGPATIPKNLENEQNKNSQAYFSVKRGDDTEN